MKLFAIAFSIMSFSMPINAAGLKAGDQFRATEVSGTVQVFCRDPRMNTSALYRCHESLISPSWRSKFITTADADKVTLSYTDHRGRTKTKSSKVRDGESTRNFNLWVGSLTQRPLLKYGENVIDYKLTRDNAEVESGTFHVNVDRAPMRTCSHRTYYSANLDDCRNSLNVCNYYFREQNYCR